MHVTEVINYDGKEHPVSKTNGFKLTNSKIPRKYSDFSMQKDDKVTGSDNFRRLVSGDLKY